MNEVEISLVQESFEKLIPKIKKANEFFYSRLNDIDSTISLPLIKDTDDCALDSINTIGNIVNALNNLEKLAPELKALGLKYKAYNFDIDTYQTTGAVFINTLANSFGHYFTPKLMNAWAKAYKLATALMIKGAGY